MNLLTRNDRLTGRKDIRVTLDILNFDPAHHLRRRDDLAGQTRGNFRDPLDDTEALRKVDGALVRRGKIHSD